ncbi:MAG TPA: SDR family oxidoreductase [Acidimicrobiales bacterium]|nr:SDR family oxidoreductase [Acidimicrobiales bacterium]
MSDLCKDRVAIVTGAGRGIGRGHALSLAAAGARVVVNDLGAERDGTGAASAGPAQEVVDEIKAMGGDAIVNGDDVSDFDAAGRMVQSAIDTWGRLDIVVNNAGILRDRMLTNMTEAEWDAVIKVHLKGTFGPAHHAAAYWRERAKAGETNDARLINTTSVSGIFGNPGQTNYGAAKAGIAAFTVIAAQELGRYGVTVNAVSPGALTRMTADLNPNRPEVKPGQFDRSAPENIAPIVTWLASPESHAVTGRVFIVAGGVISVAEGWRTGPTTDKGDRWDPAELGPVVEKLVADAAPNTTMRG